jgi:hypothetical protein
MAFWSALRRWGERAVDSGMLTVADVRNDAIAACTLLPAAISPAPMDPPVKPAPVAPAERPGDPAELLAALLGVPSEGWPALAAAMSDELFDRLKRWHAARLAKNRPQFRSGTP